MDLHSARIRQHALEDNASSLDLWERFAIDVTAALVATQSRIVELQRQLLSDVKAGVDPSIARQSIVALVDDAEGFRALKLEVDSKVLELEILAGRR